MKKRTLLTLIGGVVSSIASLAIYSPIPVSAYETTEFVLHKYKTPTISISMNQPIVGDNDLEQINGLPVSTSFYKPVDISVSNVKSYYVSVFLDCSALSGEEKTKCEAGNLLTSSGEILKSVDNAKTFGTMNNEWGFRYNIGSSVQDPKDKYFAPLPTAKANGYLQLDGEERIKTDSSTNSDSKTLTLGFGAKVDGDTAAGTYNGKVTVAVVTAPSELTFGDVATMQQLNHDICAAAGVHDTVRLRDERDDKYYWVTKLEDQHCWMSQNLDLDVYANESDGSVYAGVFDKYEGNTGGTLSSTGVKLTKDNTDITSNTLSTTAMPNSTTQDVVLSGASVTSGDMSKNSWDQGLYIINNPSATTACVNGTGIKDCTQFTNVSSGWTSAEDPNFTNLDTYKQNGITYTKTAGSPIDETHHIYDAHYLVGNYYQFNAATAGSGDGLVNADAPDSLCPAGWKLPSTGTMGDVNNRSTFGFMLRKYNLVTDINNGQLSGDLNGETTNIALSPLFFVRGGLVGLDNMTVPLRVAGQESYSWSARVNDKASHAYYLWFATDPTSVKPARSNVRHFGLSIRCVMH